MKINPFFKLDLNSSQTTNHTFGQKVKFLVYSYFLALAVSFVLMLFVTMPMDFFVMKVLHFESIQKTLNPLYKSAIKYPIYLIVLIGPFFEEILFRLALVINRKNISLFLGVLIFELLGGKISTFDINNQLYQFYILSGIAVSIISYFYFPKQIIYFLNKYRNYLIKFSILLFGLLHISNAYEYHWQLVTFYPFFVMPQLILGYFITNLRMKYGFWWGLALHIIFNAKSFIF
jgi:hypothetical protein